MTVGSALLVTGAITSMYTVAVVSHMLTAEGVDTGNVAGMAFCGGILSLIQMIAGGINRH